MLRQHRVTRASLAALASLSLVIAVPTGLAHAESTPAQDCVSAGNVWVLVDLDGTIDGGCATKFSTGREALISAGFTVVANSWGGVDKINGAPNPAGATDWWSYWNNTPAADGSYPGWSFYQVGDSSSAPKPGSVEGWRLWHSFDEDAQAPTVDPMAGFVLVRSTPTATPTPSSTPSPTPSSTPTQSPEPSESPAPSPEPSTLEPTASPSQTPTESGPGLPATGN